MEAVSVSKSLNPMQKAILDGLKEIGPEISGFYNDAIYIINNVQLQARTNLLGHLAREIDGGIRDVFSSDLEEKKYKNLIKENKINLDGLSKDHLLDIKDNKAGHIISIMSFLEIQELNSLALEWISVATQFHKMAHRHGVWKEPRPFDEMLDLWKRYEKILFQLIGNYLNLSKRIDRVIKMDSLYYYDKNEKINKLENIIYTLPNIINNSPSRKKYFFTKVQSVKWFVPLKIIGFFRPENNPEPYESENPGYYFIPYWWEIVYLENISKKISKEEIKKEFIQTIEAIMEYKKPDGNRVENFRTDHSLIKILFSLPLENNKDEYFLFLHERLNSNGNHSLISGEIKNILTNFIEHKNINHIVNLLKIILNYRLNNRYVGQFESVIGNYWLQTSISDDAIKSISNICSRESIEICINIIEQAIVKGNVFFIYSNFLNNDFNNYENAIFSILNKFLTFTNSKIAKEISEKFLYHKAALFRKISFNAINCHYQDLKNIFWELTDNPLNDRTLKNEIYILIKSNSISFSNEEIGIILKWIESANYDIPDAFADDANNKEKFLVYNKKKWLYTLLENKDDRIHSLYNQYNNINPIQVEDFQNDFFTVSQTGEISPISENDLLEKSHAERIQFLIDFKEENKWNSPTINGLENVLQGIVSNNPEIFIKELSSYSFLPLNYKSSIICGFKDALYKNKEFSHEMIINFIYDDYKLISSKEEIDSISSYYILELSLYFKIMLSSIKIKLKDDSVKKIKEIILNIFIAQEIKVEEDYNDLISKTLNSTEGKLIEALFAYLLYYAKNNEGDSKWEKDIRDLFTERMNREKYPSEVFSCALGLNFLNLYYLDKDWVKTNINRIFPKENDIHWEATFSSYIFFHSKVYKEIYALLLDSSNIKHAIDYPFNENYVKIHLAQNIGLSILYEWEKLSDSNCTIRILIEKNKFELIESIINFYWSQKENQKLFDLDVLKNKIKEIWKLLFNHYNNSLNTLQAQKIICSLGKLLSIIDSIDEEFYSYLLVIAKCMKVNPEEASFFIEYLREKSERQPKEVINIFTELLNAGVFPHYKQENILFIVEIAYSNQLKEEADKICNSYGEQGFDFLREIYGKNNP